MSNNNGTINSLFLQAAGRATFNPNSWVPQGDPVSLESLWNLMYPGYYEKIDHIERVDVQFSDGIGKKLRVYLQGGQTLDLACSERSMLTPGQYVDKTTVTGQMLTKLGQPNIVKFDGVAVAV